MSITEFGPYTLRRLRAKGAKVADNGFTATLYRHGHPVATLDCGHGPDDDTLIVSFITEAEQQFFRSAVDALVVDEDPDMDADERFLRDLAEHTYHRIRLADVCKHSTVFRFPSDPPGFWRIVRAPFREALAAALRQRFAGRTLQFANQG